MTHHYVKSSFANAIVKFNSMYGMPVADAPAFLSAQRLKNFKSILTKELSEIDDIIDMAEKLEGSAAPLTTIAEDRLELQVALADLLGDLQVYCASEMAKWGLPLDETLAIIMNSNFSKMGADGEPVYDGQGKLQKGPDYWKPEPSLKAMLQAHMMLDEAERQQKEAAAITSRAAQLMEFAHSPKVST